MSAVKPLQCSRCVLDTKDDPQLEFNALGVCNHCIAFDRQIAALPPTPRDREREFRSIIERVKKAGKGQPYDSILGVSGGVDSSYLAYVARREGLRPLTVHFDNGWNSELAVQNIQRVVSRLDLDLKTYVINWEEFKQLQLAYLKASVIDIEVLTDHAIYGALIRLALEHNIRFILSGNNIATEGVLPYCWTYKKSDYVNIQDIYGRFGTGSVKTYPFLTRKLKAKARAARIEIVTPLDYLDYTKATAKSLLVNEFGWRDYGGKHYESIFTRFYQSYILPTKFGIDKRKAHLSSLICSGQITKEEALKELEAPIYPREGINSDRDYVLKKLGITRTEFDALMSAPPRDHREFEVEGTFFGDHRRLRPLKPTWNAFKSRAKSGPLHQYAVRMLRTILRPS